jgi:hypothetical protein
MALAVLRQQSPGEIEWRVISNGRKEIEDLTIVSVCVPDPVGSQQW